MDPRAPLALALLLAVGGVVAFAFDVGAAPSGTDPAIGLVPAAAPEGPTAEPASRRGPTLRSSAPAARIEGDRGAAAKATEDAAPEPAHQERHGRRLHLDVVDAETGLPLRAVWSWTCGAGQGEPESLEADVRDSTRPVPTLGWYDDMTWVVFAPAGYVAWDEGKSAWRDGPSIYATRLEAVHPLRREALLEATVREWNDTLAVDAGVTDATIAGRSVPHAEIEPYVSGAYRVRGIPFLAGEALSLTFVPGEQVSGFRYRAATWAGSLPSTWSEVVRPDVTLPGPQGTEGIDFHASGGHRNLLVDG